MEVSDFVLANFGTAEKKDLPVTLELAADAAESIVLEGVTAAQQRFHGK
jgi:PTH1 family peptidyl-tRNA hydrolase